MNTRKSPLAMVAYFILGLIVIAVAVRVILWVLGILAFVAGLVITVAIAIGVGYLAYLILRAMIRSSQ